MSWEADVAGRGTRENPLIAEDFVYMGKYAPKEPMGFGKVYPEGLPGRPLSGIWPEKKIRDTVKAMDNYSHLGPKKTVVDGKITWSKPEPDFEKVKLALRSLSSATVNNSLVNDFIQTPGALEALKKAREAMDYDFDAVEFPNRGLKNRAYPPGERKDPCWNMADVMIKAMTGEQYGPEHLMSPHVSLKTPYEAGY
jgi:hypothetical protein